MLQAPCFTGAPQCAPRPPRPEPSRPCGPRPPAAQVRPGGDWGAGTGSWAPQASGSAPAASLGCFLPSQVPGPRTLLSTSGSLRERHSRGALRSVLPPPRPLALNVLLVARGLLSLGLFHTAPCQALVSVRDLQATLRGTSSAPSSLDR